MPKRSEFDKKRLHKRRFNQQQTMNDKMIEDGGPAFPFKCQGPTTAPETYYGMSLRDWFAGQALCGMIGHLEQDKPITTAADFAASMKHAAFLAYVVADAMIAARGGAR